MANMTEEERAARVAQVPDRSASVKVVRDPNDNKSSATAATVQVVVGPENKTETREILVGVTSRISAEVLSGLKEGDRVVAGVIQAQPETDNNSSGRFYFR